MIQLTKRSWRFGGFKLAVLFFWLAFPLQFIYSQTGEEKNTSEMIALELTKTIEREFTDKAEKKHLYRIALSAGQYANVIIEQQGVDVAARISAADGQLLGVINSNGSAQGSEKIELAAETAGEFIIEASPALPKIGIGKYSIRLTELRAATADEILLNEARRRYFEAGRFNGAGNFEKALEAANRALEIREKILGLNSAETATAVNIIGAIYLGKNDLAQAEKFFNRAAEIFAKISGAESLAYSEALTGMAGIRFSQGNFTEAEKLHQRALAIREKATGADGILVAKSLFSLAWVYRTLNDLPKAEKLLLRALSVFEKSYGENHSDVGLTLNNLGLLYYGAGDFSNAQTFMGRSLAVREKVFPANHQQIGIALNNLGLIEWRKGDREKAKAYYLRAMKIFEIANGAESDGVASISHNLGIIYKEDGDKVEAERNYRRALAIWEKIFGENNQSTATAASSLAILYRNSGDYERAEQFQLRALGIYEKVLGAYNYYTTLSLRNLVRIYASKGDAKRAVEYEKRIGAIEEKIIPLNLSFGSERQKIAYYKQLESLDRIISLNTAVARDDAAAVELAATAVLQRKGRILDALADNLAALRRRLDPQSKELLDKLVDVNSRLSKAILSGRQKLSPEDYQNRLKTLEAERETLESEIGRLSSGFYERSQPVTLAAVRAAIPADAALVEFAVYRPYDWKGKSDETNYGAPRYIAYVLRRQGEIQWIELDDAKTVDAAIDDWRKALRDPARQDAPTLARATHEKIMQPLRAALGDAKQILVSPDGALNLIPFEALVDEQNKFLVENYSFTYLTSGRDLLRMQIARQSKNNSLIVANPLFGEPPAIEERTAGIKKPEKKPLQSVIPTRDLSDVYFTPLGGTAQEANSIKTLFPDASFLTGAQATETALKQTNAPRVLHIATHGFFLEDVENDSAENSPTAKKREADAVPQSENPLLRSGLALAGANRRGSGGGDDGILTALEAANLNLWGTKLVVLSACDTGLGNVKTGEGVYGLRRSFVLAGTESLVMSLWSVSDYVTRELMTDYYKNLKQGIGRAESLRQVQLTMLKRQNRRHPFYWAAFIQSGEWATLDGKR